MVGREALTAFMTGFAAELSTVLPSGMAAGVVGDWVVLTTRYGLDGYEAAVELDDSASLRTIQGRVHGTLHVLQEAVIAHLTEPWPTISGMPRRASHGNVWLPDAETQLEGSTIHAFYGYQ